MGKYDWKDILYVVACAIAIIGIVFLEVIR